MTFTKYIFSLLINSVSSLPFYYELRQVKFRDSLLTYFLFLCVVALFNAVWFWQITKPRLQAEVASSITQVVQSFPESLIIKWNGEKLESNTSPVSISMPKSAPEFIAELADNLILINTDGSPTDETALLMVTDTSVILRAAGQSGEPMSLNTFFMSPFTISADSLPWLKQSLQQTAANAFQFASTAYFFLYLLYILFSRSLMLLFESLIIYVLFKLNRIPYSLKQIVQLSLHIFIPAELVNQVAIRVIPDFPVSLHSLTFWILFLVIFFSTQTRGVIHQPRST